MKTKDKPTTALQPRETGFFDEMDRAFDMLTNRGWLHPFRAFWPEWAPLQPDLDVRVPRVDLVDRETEFLVRVELPGIDKQDVHVDLNGDLLTIRAERRHEQKTEEGNVYRAEILRGTFGRTIRVPAEIKTDEVQADFENGMLEIHLPKAESTKRQKIEIK